MKNLDILHPIQSSFILINIISQEYGWTKVFKQQKTFRTPMDPKILSFKILLFDKLFIYLMVFAILCALCFDIQNFFQIIFYLLWLFKKYFTRSKCKWSLEGRIQLKHSDRYKILGNKMMNSCQLKIWSLAKNHQLSLVKILQWIHLEIVKWLKFLVENTNPRWILSIRLHQNFNVINILINGMNR